MNYGWFTGAEIAAATGGKLVMDAPSGRIVTDSRAITPGDWFLALAGERFDGHGFIADVLAKGAAGVVVSKHVDGASAGIVQVQDTTKAYQALGRAARDRFPGPVIGIGGAAGKTTTRALATLALSGLGVVHQNAANLNNHIGVPLTLLQTPADAKALVVEMGTSGVGEMAVLVECARPDVRVIVNIGPEHLEGLGDLDGVAKEEGVTFDTAQPGDVLIVNVDDDILRNWPRPDGTRVITYGEASEATIQLVSARIDTDLRTHVVWQTPSGEIAAVLPAPGKHIAHNAAAALACAFAVGLDLGGAAAALEGYEPVGMRMRKETLEPGIIVLNDAYNANPPSMEASLSVLAALPGRKIAILGDMLELGDEEARWHDHVAAFASGLGLDLLVLVGPRMSQASATGSVWVHPDASDVAEKLKTYLRSGDVVLFKGSRGARMEQILQTLRGELPGGSH